MYIYIYIIYKHIYVNQIKTANNAVGDVFFVNLVMRWNGHVFFLIHSIK